MKAPPFYRNLLSFLGFVVVVVSFIIGVFLFGTSSYLRYPFADRFGRIDDPIFAVIMFIISVVGGFLLAYPVYLLLYLPICRWINKIEKMESIEKAKKLTKQD
jgi:hypothetical protein